MQVSHRNACADLGLRHEDSPLPLRETVKGKGKQRWEENLTRQAAMEIGTLSHWRGALQILCLLAFPVICWATLPNPVSDRIACFRLPQSACFPACLALGPRENHRPKTSHGHDPIFPCSPATSGLCSPEHPPRPLLAIMGVPPATGFGVCPILKWCVSKSKKLGSPPLENGFSSVFFLGALVSAVFGPRIFLSVVCLIQRDFSALAR